MTWLVWRQHRIQFYLGAGLLAAFAALIVNAGLQTTARDHAVIASCAAGHGCIDLSRGGLFQGDPVVGLSIIATLGAPLLIGLFLGGPLVASELEAGTIRFAWMQSVTRMRWFAAKAGWMLLAAATWGGVIAALVTWLFSPGNSVAHNEFNPGRFDLVGIVPVAYAVFAMALGITAGVLLRRTLPALAVTLAGFLALRVVVTLWLRPHYLSAVTTLYSLTGRGVTPRGSYWKIAEGVFGPNGTPVPGAEGLVLNGVPLSMLPSSCQAAVNSGPGGSGGIPSSCAQALSRFHGFLTYQPASRFWAFQWIESGVFVVLAAALLAVAAFVLLRRDA